MNQEKIQTPPSSKKSGRGQTLTTVASACLIVFLGNIIPYTRSGAGYAVLEVALRTANVDVTVPTGLPGPHSDKLVDMAAFDIIVQVAYDMAFSTLATPPRQEFDLSQWKNKGTGGLRDKDRVLLAQIYRNASSVFEFGLGESTLIASHVGVPRYSGIDSDALWVSQSRDAVHPHFRFYLADIGSTGKWGFPNGSTLPKTILNYQIAPLLVEPSAFDVYMVDGRMRLACMIASFLHASRHGAPHNHTMVLLHDCGWSVKTHKRLDNGTRMVYREGHHLLDLVHHSGEKLCVYRRKPNTTDADLLKLWLTYSDDLNR
ncbi:O-linked N-acetylglucosamine transferase SPINDLY family [Fragilaria crotonensis]|nr:O-linked N-acetylglucosamine transferase SPINDLY family [Fragilaria crotonensis]